LMEGSLVSLFLSLVCHLFVLVTHLSPRLYIPPIPLLPMATPPPQQQQHQPQQTQLQVQSPPPPEHGHCFVVGTFRVHEHQMRQGTAWIDSLQTTIQRQGGLIQLRSDKPKLWTIIDGKDHNVEPHHLEPAVFDFTTIMLAAFPSTQDLQLWWSSDEVFDVMKQRHVVEKVGIFPLDGLRVGQDLREMKGFGDRYVLLEFFKMLKYQPVQQYVDNYKRFASAALKTIGLNCNLLFAETTSGVLMNEFPLEAACASTWRSHTESQVWLESKDYQQVLKAGRHKYSKCLVVMVPIFEEKLEQMINDKKNPGTLTRLT